MRELPLRNPSGRTPNPQHGLHPLSSPTGQSRPKAVHQRLRDDDRVSLNANPTRIAGRIVVKDR